MSRENFLNIGRYFAFAECLECRGALLRGEKNLPGFYEQVFPFVLSSLRKEQDGEKMKKQEQKMWVYAAYQQIAYAKALCAKKADTGMQKKFTDLVNDIKERAGYGKFQSIKKLYEGIVLLDKIPCSYANCISSVPSQTEPDGFSDFITDTEDGEQLGYLLPYIVKNINLYIKTAKYFQKIDKAKGEQHDPVPAKIIASLAVFTSHLGRTVCLHYKGESEKARDEIKKSIDHLRRCVMDTCKLTIDYLNSHPDWFGGKHEVPYEFWDIALRARRMEHDREDIKVRIEQYEKTHPFIEDFLAKK